MKIVVKTLASLENILADEIRTIGGKNIEILNRAVQFEGDLETLYKANYLLRTALRVLVPLITTQVRNEEQLYQAVKNIAWEDIFTLNQSFALDGTTHSSYFTHSKYAALKSKDAIADRFREKFDKRPNVHPYRPDIRINIHISEFTLTVSLDSSGESLHMRGYRQHPVDAPLNEVLAAGLILLSGWDKTKPFFDPMCGSGTLAIEAGRIAMNMPPQDKDRPFCFKSWQDYDKSLWDNIISESEKAIVEPSNLILASDKSMHAFKATQINIQSAGLERFIKVTRQDFFKSEGIKDAFIVLNPPYGERLKLDDANAFYKSIGDYCKQHYHPGTLCVLSGNITALKNLGLKPSKKIPMMNGQLESAFYIFELYEGSK